MPIYEYKCSECGSHFEKMQKVSEEPLTICEKCGGKLEKQWSLSGFQFKGEGWYVTDYAGKKEKVTEKPDKAVKTSASDSTEKTKTASNEKSDSSSSSKKETVSKKE